MYVHHDITLNAYPLCTAWLHLGGGKNYAAVGQFDNNIDLWDLDVLEAMSPALQLEGGSPDSSSSKKSKKKKKKKPAGVAQENRVEGSSGGARTSGGEMGHTAPVMCLDAHPTEHHLLVSGGADNLVKVWNLNEAKCVASFSHHTDKVGI